MYVCVCVLTSTGSVLHDTNNLLRYTGERNATRTDDPKQRTSENPDFDSSLVVVQDGAAEKEGASLKQKQDRRSSSG